MSRRPASRAPVPIITLYDLQSASPQPWAPNIQRIRFILNYKRLRYQTVFVEFPDVEATLRSIGAPPSAMRSDGRPLYTLPVLVDPTRNPQAPHVLVNPNLIAEYLESAYPAYPIFPAGTRALQTLFVHYIQEVFVKPLLPILVPLSQQSLPERSQSHFRHHSTSNTSHVRHGSTMGTPGPPSPSSAMQMLPPGPVREQAWRAVQEQFDFLAVILDKNANDGVGDGVVACGAEVSYADFALCSVLVWIQRMAANDGWARIRDWNGGRWARLWDRCRAYMDEY
ncbi:GST N-terminal domain-containing protein [Mycena chlorophos]|uniref:GST N-terminal domain-containing protein n=1 Tax=Mycena chlorophos TaxID=658473 RepID=A0A8H6TC31_MYCCL|nr:GST N-terminal domain-containing protein [Mycena chlorophos]